jgi:heme O synthase-like polyprenyltransferase
MVPMLMGTFFCAFSASVWNQMKEVDFDRQMVRTAIRPLPRGTMSVPFAAVLCALNAIFGAWLLYKSADSWVPPFLGWFTIVTYALLYTPMKRTSSWNTALGAFVGALPVLIGAATVNPHFYTELNPASLSVWSAYALMTLWQIPHFALIELQFSKQYSKAGYRMFSSIGARNSCIITLLMLSSIPILSTYYGLSSETFIYTGSLTNVLLAGVLLHWWQNHVQQNPVNKIHRRLLYVYFTANCILICVQSLTADFWGVRNIHEGTYHRYHALSTPPKPSVASLDELLTITPSSDKTLSVST